MSESRYPQVIRTVSESPWAILPAKLAAIVDVIRLRAEGVRISDEEVRERVGEPRDPEPFLAFANAEGGVEYAAFDAAARNGRVQSGGAVAVLPVFGTIFPRANLFTSFSGGTTAQGFQEMFAQALADDQVGSILMEIDSPGGMIDMIPETAAAIRGARGQKPIVAVANTLAASAAYWLAAQADEVVVAPSGMIGSIGVFTVHQDQSELDAKIGVTTTLISAGKYKTEGNPFEPLSDEARASLQARVNEFYGMFVSDVAKGRGAKVEDVRGGYGEGRVVSAKAAVAEGMADRVATLDETIARMARGNVSSRAVRGEVERIIVAQAAAEQRAHEDRMAEHREELAAVLPDSTSTHSADRLDLIGL